MLILARCLGIVIMCMGIAIAINPNVFKTILHFWNRDKKVYIAGALRIIFGTIFLAVAPECRLATVVSILGFLMIIGGALIFIMGPKRLQAIFAWWEKKPPVILRLIGLVALALGTLVLYSI